MRAPLLAPAAALMAGVALTRIADFGLVELAVAGAILTGLAILASRRRRILARTCGLLAVVSAGAFVAEYHRPGPPPQLDTELDEPVLIAGCVVEPSVFFQDREQFTLELEPGARARVSLYVKEGAQPPNLRYGQLVEVEARVRTPRNFHNPGSFDYAGYLARRDIYWTAAVRTGATVRVLPGKCGSRLLSAVYDARSAMLSRIERLYPEDEYSSSMMRAILLGESSRLEKAWVEHFRRTGTYHALVGAACHGAGGSPAVSAAHLFRTAGPRVVSHIAGRVGLRDHGGLVAAGPPCGGRTDFVPCRAALLSAWKRS
jgi:competence protein ComEC